MDHPQIAHFSCQNEKCEIDLKKWRFKHYGWQVNGSLDDKSHNFYASYKLLPIVFTSGGIEKAM